MGVPQSTVTMMNTRAMLIHDAQGSCTTLSCYIFHAMQAQCRIAAGLHGIGMIHNDGH